MPYSYVGTGGIDTVYLLIALPVLLLTLWAQIRVKTTFKKYSAVRLGYAMTGAEAARMILDRNGLYAVRIERIAGELTDHFDPTANVLRLSESVHDSVTAAAVGVAAHEAGHAVQYAEQYAPMRARAAVIPISQFGSKMAMPLFLIGLLFAFPTLCYAGIVCYSLATLFQLITLPVEFDASNRALKALDDSRRFTADELTASRKVLRAAAMTYVAALATSLVQLLRLVLVARSNSNRRR